MMGEESEKPRIDIKDVKTLIQLFAVFLIISESLIGLWFVKAESGIERIIAGTLFCVLMIVFLLILLNLAKSDKFSIPQADGLPPLKVNPEIPPAPQPPAPESPQIIGPDKSYTIHKPPDDWIMDEMSFDEWVSQGMSSTPETLHEMLPQLDDPDLKVRDILQFRSKRVTSVTPIPGVTTLNGVKWPTALACEIIPSLTILPLNRYFPSNFYETPFIHKYITVIGQTLTTGVTLLVKLEEQTNPASRQTIRLAQFRQELKNAVVNGEEERSIDINTALYGIEGETQEHLILIRYPTTPGIADPQIDQDLATLTSLFKSFQPAQPIDPEERRREREKRFDANLKMLIAENGKSLFDTEIALVMVQICTWNLEDPVMRRRAIGMLKPFREFAGYIRLKSENLEQLWQAIDRAEKGDAGLFYEVIQKERDAQHFQKLDAAAKTIRSWDLSDLDTITKAVLLMKPYKPLLESWGRQDPEMARLLSAIDSAEKGDLQPFREFFSAK